MKTGYGYIRLSTVKQIKGTGEERQDRLAEICNEHGWRPAEQTFKDLGVSAFKGKNRLQGKLALFIELLKEGKLASEPVLVVEAFDRISRQDIDESEPAFLEILKLGCDVHVAFNNKTFTKESLKSLYDRQEILASLKAAYEFSERLSKRIKAQRAIKFARMTNGEILKHHNSPRYYTYNASKKAFEQNELTYIVKRIIREFLAGRTLYQISRGLNENKVRSLRYANKQPYWSRMAIKSLLESKCLYGEFLGIANYFGEPVIDKLTWDTIQMTLRRNSDNRGKFSTDFVNIFRGIGFCSYCNRHMAIGVQKMNYKSGKLKAEPYRYLRCSSRANGLPCESRSQLDLSDVERSFFIDFIEKNPEDLANGNTKEALLEMGVKIAEKENELETINGKITALAELAGVVSNADLVKKGQALGIERTSIQSTIDELNNSRVSIMAAPASRDIAFKLWDGNEDWDWDAPTHIEYMPYSTSAIAKNLKDNAIRQSIRNELPNLISKVVFDTDNKTYKVYNRAGNEVFASERLDADMVGKRVTKLTWKKKHREAMRGMNPKDTIEYMGKLEKIVRGKLYRVRNK